MKKTAYNILEFENCKNTSLTFQMHCKTVCNSQAVSIFAKCTGKVHRRIRWWSYYTEFRLP